jgi:hypothetical protein
VLRRGGTFLAAKLGKAALGHTHDLQDLGVHWHVERVVLLQAPEVDEVAWLVGVGSRSVRAATRQGVPLLVAALGQQQVVAGDNARLLNEVGSALHDTGDLLAVLEVEGSLEALGVGGWHDWVHAMQQVVGAEPR